VGTELQCPDQILFGAFDWKTCPLLWLSVYLDGWLQRHPNAKYMFTDNDDEETGPSNINKRYGNRVKAVCWRNQEFMALNDQTGPDEKGLGTHSNRKWASTRASRKGARTEQVELRGRWIGEVNSSIVTRHYIDPDDYYTDAWVASCLCEGGPIKYMLRPEAQQTTGIWLYQSVVPNLLLRFARDHRFLMVMALAKLWAVFDDTACEELPLHEVGRIREAFNQAYGAIEGNPVMKVRLQVLNVDGHLQVVPAANGNDNGEGDGNGEQQQQQQQQQEQRESNNRETLALSQHHHQEVLQRLDMLQAEQQATRAWMQQMFDRVITNQRRYGGTVHSSFARGNRQEQQRRDLQQQQAASDNNNDNGAATRAPRAAGPGAQGPAARARPARLVGGDRHARLVPRPRCLYELWQEYQFGIGNNKPAKNFTMGERNSRDEGLKQKYHYRNKVWKLQSYMFNAGWTVEGMNAEISRVYNSSHVTAIVKGITADSKKQAYPMVDMVGFRINPRFFAGVIRASLQV
jgi:hypothetical protein